MKGHVVKILQTKLITGNVRQIRVEKPPGYQFKPGQATDVSINRKEWLNALRPFTFTSPEGDDYLEFIIKVYDSHGGVTQQIGRMKPGDELVIRDPWGAISFRGPGVFIAGGAGVTPFIAILRDLYVKGQIRGNMLIFSNRTYGDIILREDLERMLGDDFLNVLTRDKGAGMISGRIDREYLQRTIGHTQRKFYVCGPEQFTAAVSGALQELRVEPASLVFEK